MAKQGRRLKNRGEKQGTIITAQPSPVKSAGTGPPSFSFYKLVRGYTLEDCTPEERIDFIETLCRASKLTWPKLIGTSCNCGGIEILRYGLRIKPPDGITPDTAFYSLHMKKPGRIVGHRESDTFHILYIDTQHATYKG